MLRTIINTVTSQVLYPTVKDAPPDVSTLPASLVDYTEGFDRVFVSLNRCNQPISMVSYRSQVYLMPISAQI